MLGGGDVTPLPSSSIRPDVAFRRPAMHLSRVVLPQPDGPTMHTSSPASIRKLMSPIASTLPVDDSYTFRRFWTSSSVSGTLHLLDSVIPAQHPPLGESEDPGEQHADESEQQD